MTGRAFFAGDHAPPGLYHLAVIRSPLPHARVRSVDLGDVRGLPGVLAAWSAGDLPALGTLAGFAMPGGPSLMRPVLAEGESRYAGEPLAMVVAETPALAQDAALAAGLDLEALEATSDPLRGELAGSVQRAFGDAEAAFARATLIATAHLELARVSGGYLEPRACIAEPEGGGLLVHTSTQHAHGVRDAISAALGVDRESVRVRAPYVGGAFGAKGMAYPEEVLTAVAALRVGRPVRWVATRSEDMLTTAQSHGTALDLELAATRDGIILGLRGRIVHPIGAYAATGPGQADNIASHLVSAYRLPAMDVTVDLVYTNTVPAGFIRGGGREVGNFAIERLMDRLSRKLDLDPAELRRRNLVTPAEMPRDTGFRSPRGLFVLDGGDYPAMLERVLSEIGGRAAGQEVPGFAVGTGITCFTESTGIGEPESARLEISADGRVTVHLGTTPQGQGHATAAAQVVADHLAWPVELVDVVHGDTAGVPEARNTAASRSAVEMGNAVALAAASARARLAGLAAEALEVAEEDLELGPAGAGVRGVPESRGPLAELLPNGLEVTETYDPQKRRAYSAGSTGVLVEVDLETGEVLIRRHVFVHDVGRQINPAIVEGQVHGGAAHGAGYALYEEVVHDPDGTPRTSGFLDYSIVTAAEAPVPEVWDIDTMSMHNPGGHRGAGEGATIPFPAAVAAAVEDALRRRGLDVFIDRLPITPDRLHRIIQEAVATAEEATP